MTGDEAHWVSQVSSFPARLPDTRACESEFDCRPLTCANLVRMRYATYARSSSDDWL